MPEGIVQVTEGTGKKLHTFQRTIGANTVEDEVVLHGIPYTATYAVATSASSATANSHLVQIMAGASLNVYITGIRLYQSTLATTATLASLFVYRLTTAGTGGTTLTPVLRDTTDGASGATAMSLPSAKGTETSLLHAGAGLFIQTTPTGGGNTLLLDVAVDDLKAKPIRIPAGATNGIAIKQVTAVAAGVVLINVTYFEANF